MNISMTSILHQWRNSARRKGGLLTARTAFHFPGILSKAPGSSDTKFATAHLRCSLIFSFLLCFPPVFNSSLHCWGCFYQKTASLVMRVLGHASTDSTASAHPLQFRDGYCWLHQPSCTFSTPSSNQGSPEPKAPVNTLAHALAQPPPTPHLSGRASRSTKNTCYALSWWWQFLNSPTEGLTNCPAAVKTMTTFVFPVKPICTSKARLSKAYSDQGDLSAAV